MTETAEATETAEKTSEASETAETETDLPLLQYEIQHQEKDHDQQQYKERNDIRELHQFPGCSFDICHFLPETECGRKAEVLIKTLVIDILGYQIKRKNTAQQ